MHAMFRYGPPWRLVSWTNDFGEENKYTELDLYYRLPHCYYEDAFLFRFNVAVFGRPALSCRIHCWREC